MVIAVSPFACEIDEVYAIKKIKVGGAVCLRYHLVRYKQSKKTGLNMMRIKMQSGE